MDKLRKEIRNINILEKQSNKKLILRIIRVIEKKGTTVIKKNQIIILTKNVNTENKVLVLLDNRYRV